MRILVLEDNPDDFLSIQKRLREIPGAEFELEHVSYLKQAKERLRKGGIDLVLSDLKVPDSQGIGTIMELIKEAAQVPVVALTGTYLEESMALEAVRKGAQDYLTKQGLDGKTLVRVIRYAVERIRLQQELVKLNQMKDEFVSAVSHEIRTPMGIIQETVSQIAEGFFGKVTEKQKEVLMLSLKSVHRLGAIIDELLDISKIEAGRLALNKKLVDLGSLAKEVVSRFSLQAQEKGLELKVNFLPEKVTLYADEEKIVQILVNLLGNALKFTEKGVIEISLEDQKDGVKCSVADTGTGIAEENLPKLFQKFQQFGRVAGPGIKGTGLGLAITKALVEGHGGKIWVESKLGEGTKFSFLLPRYTAREVFKDQISSGIREAVNGKTSVSIVRFDIKNFDEACEKLGAEKVSSVVQALEGLITQGLRRRADIAMKDTRSLLVVLSATGRQDALLVAGRLVEQIDEYLSKQGLTQSLQIVKSVATFPEDAKTAEALLERAESRLTQKRKVLIVDDEPEMVELLKNRLSASERIACLEAVNGEEALRKVESERPDLIICDLKMPKMNGHELIAHLKGNPETREIPVVILTAYKEETEKIAAVVTGGIPVFLKTDGFDRLIKAIDNLI